MHEDLRASLIKQFPSEVVELTQPNGKKYYACPTCKRAIGRSDTKCNGCLQVLSWDNIRQIEIEKTGIKTATLSFEVPGDFTKGNCRKCPLSYISKSGLENIYECPLKMRNACRLEISDAE